MASAAHSNMHSNGLDVQFADAMGHLLGPDFPDEIGLAVSGGGDSMAMLTLAHNWSHIWGVKLWVVTIDHGLRPESADEAVLVSDTCAELGWPHATLRWHWDGRGNVMDAARRARLSLIDQWRGNLRHVLMAHTRDDVAETFLMRLKRGSGVDGLSAMQARRRIRPVTDQADPLDYDGVLPAQVDRIEYFDVIRPCLDMPRQDLRHYLRVLKGCWVEDPTNENDAYDRARIRKLLPLLETEGFGVDLLAATAQRLTRARQALQDAAEDAAIRFIRIDEDSGDVIIAREGFAHLSVELQLRLLAAGLQFVSGEPYRPRLRALEDLLERLLSGGGGTLSGCEARAMGADLRLWRELTALSDQEVKAEHGAIWDGRWSLVGTPPDGSTIAALGQIGWEQIAKKPDNAPPHASARSLPALWQDDTLLACPALGVDLGIDFLLRETNLILGDQSAFPDSH